MVHGYFVGLKGAAYVKDIAWTLEQDIPEFVDSEIVSSGYRIVLNFGFLNWKVGL